uniref:synaptobrevin homolog 1-like n=1 Tax=Gasterosteus aculeatus aculeatus TaxID=481459 RepID=UPI001A98C53C|nr:synaptobrevin homolog 1-like [Gasterosteus aculeatus aculeatus]
MNPWKNYHQLTESTLCLPPSLIMLRVSIGQMNGKSRLQQVQGDVEEVRDIMLDNLNKADERNGNLVELEDRADVLLEKAKKFEKTTSKLIQKKRWGKKKMFVFIGIGATVAVVILGLIIYFIVPGTQ